MHPFLKRAVVAALLSFAAGSALAQVSPAAQGRPASRPSAQAVRPGGYSYEAYGLQNCSSRPFASGCDKRGTW